MSTCNHLWMRRWTLSGRRFEKCHECDRARMPRLGDAEAAANAGTAVGSIFKRLYGAHIADLIPRPSSAPWPWGMGVSAAGDKYVRDIPRNEGKP